MNELLKTSAATLLTATVLVLLWMHVTGPGGLGPAVLPGPADVAGALRTAFIEGQLYPHIAFTAEAAAIGLAIGAGLGIVCGGIVVSVPVLEHFVVPLVTALQSVPKIAIAPLFVAYLGFGIGSKIFTAALLCFFPLFVAAVTGLRAVDSRFLDLYRACSASRLHVMLNLRIPAAAPYLFAAMQIAVILSLIGCVVSEFVASARGLGYVIKARSNELDVSMMFAAILTLSVMGVIGSLAFRLLQQRVVFWARS